MILARTGTAPRMRLASLLSTLAALGWLGQAWIVALAIQAMLQNGNPGQPALIFLLLGLVRALLSGLADRLAQSEAEEALTRLRREIVVQAARGEILAAPGALAALVEEKAELLIPYLTRFDPALWRVRVVPLVILLAAFGFSWVAGLVLLLTGPLIPLFMALIGHAAKEVSLRQVSTLGTLADLMLDRMGAALDIRLLGAATAQQAAFDRGLARLRGDTMAVLRLAFLSSTVLELFAAIGVAMLAAYVGFTLLGLIHFGGLSTAQGIFLLLIAPDFYQPFRDLAAAWHDRAGAEALEAELAALPRGPGLIGTGDRVAPLPGLPSIRLPAGALPDGRLLPTMTIAPGEAVALTGPSGAGKTTLLRRIAGLLPAPGALVAGAPLESRADAWRARLGWMPQAPWFLDRNLADNLSLGRSGDLMPALRAARAEGILAALPDGLASRLGASGAGLSGGEARRIALARALLGHPEVIIADEPTADLDAETAEAVTNGLLAAHAAGATLILSSHDPALLARMTRVIEVGT